MNDDMMVFTYTFVPVNHTPITTALLQQSWYPRKVPFVQYLQLAPAADPTPPARSIEYRTYSALAVHSPVYTANRLETRFRPWNHDQLSREHLQYPPYPPKSPTGAESRRRIFHRIRSRRWRMELLPLSGICMNATQCCIW